MKKQITINYHEDDSRGEWSYFIHNVNQEEWKFFNKLEQITSEIKDYVNNDSL